MEKKLNQEERRLRRFTESFRKEQVELIERGEVTIAQVSRRYEVRATNVGKWVKRYGKKRDAGLVIGSSKDFDRLRLVEEENARLKILFGEQQLKLLYMEKLLELAKRELGSDFEKKAGTHY